MPENHTLEQARSTFSVVRATSSKFGLHAGNMKFSTQNKE
jgi:hypothetical protein